MPCDMTDVLHVAAIDIGTIWANHYQIDFVAISYTVEVSRVITKPMDIKIVIDYAILFLTCFFTFQGRDYILRKLNGTNAVILWHCEIPVCRCTSGRILFLP